MSLIIIYCKVSKKTDTLPLGYGIGFTNLVGCMVYDCWSLSNLLPKPTRLSDYKRFYDILFSLVEAIKI